MEKSRSDMVIHSNDELLMFQKSYAESSELNTYVNKVYAMLINLKAGSTINIDAIVETKNMDKFIKSVCMYITESKHDNVVFSSDYMTIKKLK